MCGNAWWFFAETGVGAASASFAPMDPVFPISGRSTALVAPSAAEGRHEPKMGLFRVKQGPIYALIAAIRGRMPMMCITRVRL